MAKQIPDRTRTFRGLAVNSGKIYAPVCLYSAERHRTVKRYFLEHDDEVREELDRYERALDACSTELDEIAAKVAESVGRTEAEIFVTQKHIMSDPVIVDAIRTGITGDRSNAEYVIYSVFGGFEEKFSKLDNEYLRERSTDIGEIRRRLLDHLGDKRPGFICQGQQHCARGENRIIVAQELTSNMIAHMEFGRVLGFVTEHGGVNSHAAIIARSLGIPAVSGTHGIMDALKCGSRLLVDGDSGSVYVEPDQKLISTLIPIEPVTTEDVCALRTPAGMELLANASLLDDARLAAAMHADGIGLFRTEIAFLKADRLLTEDEQYEFYAEVVRRMSGKPVTFRLLDVGGDKELPFLKLQKESNPYLGWRGARFLLGNPEILTTQTRALLRASKIGKVKLLFPMIIDAGQLKQLIDAVTAAMQSWGGGGDAVDMGAMFEVPSACLQAREIYRLVDFCSIGSNDLTQYLFAVDRNNELVSQDYNPDHPVLWDTLKSLGTAAREAGKPLSICGEMAGREGMPSRLIDIGITSLSISPRLIPRVRNEMARHAAAMQDQRLSA